MKKLLMTSAILVTMAGVPSLAIAQENTFAGAAVGAGTGFVVGGPPGALVGGLIGGAVGATTEPRYYVEPRCWRDEFGRRLCR